MQTSYSTDQGAAAYEGQLYDSGFTGKLHETGATLL